MARISPVLGSIATEAPSGSDGLGRCALTAASAAPLKPEMERRRHAIAPAEHLGAAVAVDQVSLRVVHEVFEFAGTLITCFFGFVVTFVCLI